MYSTRLHVYTRASLTDILARILASKSARVGGQVGEDRRACPARGKLNGEVAGHADILATILARKSARMSVSVSVRVGVRVGPWNSSLTAPEDIGQWQILQGTCYSSSGPRFSGRDVQGIVAPNVRNVVLKLRSVLTICILLT